MEENEISPEEEIQRLHGMYASFAQNAIGQIVLDDLKKRFHIHSTTVKTGTLDPYELAYAEGQRSVVLFLIAMGEIGKQAEKQ